MPVDLEEKFRTVGLSETDEPRLLAQILDTDDTFELLSYLHIYGYSFGTNDRVLELCNYYIKHPVPGLTAVCMRVIIDYWGRAAAYFHVIEEYLDVKLLDKWYDEIIFAVGFINRNKQIDFPPNIMRKFNDIILTDEIKALGIL